MTDTNSGILPITTKNDRVNRRFGSKHFRGALSMIVFLDDFPHTGLRALAALPRVLQGNVLGEAREIPQRDHKHASDRFRSTFMSDEDLENFVMPTFSFRPLRPEEERPEDGGRIFIRSDNPKIYVEDLGVSRDRSSSFALFWDEKKIVFRVAMDVDDRTDPKNWKIKWTIVGAGGPATGVRSYRFKSIKEFEIATQLIVGALWVYNARPTHHDHAAFQMVVDDVSIGASLKRRIEG